MCVGVMLCCTDLPCSFSISTSTGWSHSTPTTSPCARCTHHTTPMSRHTSCTPIPSTSDQSVPRFGRLAHVKLGLGLWLTLSGSKEASRIFSSTTSSTLRAALADRPPSASACHPQQSDNSATCLSISPPPWWKSLPLTRLTSLRLASQKVCTGRMCGNSSAPTLTCNGQQPRGSALRLRGAIQRMERCLRLVLCKATALPAVPWPR